MTKYKPNDYGIGAALDAMLRTLEHSARRTGRTTRMLDALREGDQVIAMNADHAQILRRDIRERGLKDVSVIAVPDTAQGAVLSKVHPATRKGVTHFDHTWVEKFYAGAIAEMRKDFEQLGDVLSSSRDAEPVREPFHVDA